MNKYDIALITRGDDCGSNHSANIGILKAVNKGILKNVSLMVTCPYIEEAAEWFKDRDDICFGLHAVLNSEWTDVRWGSVLPAEEVPSLIDKEGYFHQSPHHFLENKPRIDEIMAELKAQLDKAQSLGFHVSYLDSHMMFEWAIPELEEPIAKWVREEGLLYHKDYIQELPLVHEAEGDPVDRFVARLEAARPGQYKFVAHPAVDSAEMRSLGNEHENGEEIARTRDWDIRLFTDERVTACLRRKRMMPIRYDQADRVQSD